MAVRTIRNNLPKTTFYLKQSDPIIFPVAVGSGISSERFNFKQLSLYETMRIRKAMH